MELARALGFVPRDATPALVAGAVAMNIWPGRHTSLHQAALRYVFLGHFRHRGMVYKYDKSLRELFQRVGGKERIQEALTPLLSGGELNDVLAAQQAADNRQ